MRQYKQRNKSVDALKHNSMLNALWSLNVMCLPRWSRPSTNWCCRCLMRIGWRVTTSSEWWSWRWSICPRSKKAAQYRQKSTSCDPEGIQNSGNPAAKRPVLHSDCSAWSRHRFFISRAPFISTFVCVIIVFVYTYCMLTAVLSFSLSLTGGAVYSGYSARSRVRGHLEIYHAYIIDGAPPEHTEDSLTASEDRDWEMVNAHGTVEQPTQVRNDYTQMYLVLWVT